MFQSISAGTSVMTRCGSVSQNEAVNRQGNVSEPETLGRMSCSMLLVKGKKVAETIVAIHTSCSRLKVAALNLLEKSLGDSGLLYYDLADSHHSIKGAITKSPEFRLDVQEAIEKMMAFLEQHRYPQRDHHDSMFYQGS